jgi:hypothetical protein
MITASALVFASACGGETPAMTGPKGNVVIEDGNNYTANSTLTIPSVTTASGADLMVCWDAIMKDILCHDVSATADIDNVAFLQIPNMSKPQVQAKLANGTLDEALVKIYRDHHVDHTVAPPQTCANISSFSLGTMLMPATDYVEAADKTYMLLFAHGTTPGVGARTMTFLDPSAASTVMKVDAPDGCSSNILDFVAMLGLPLEIPTAGPWQLDWSKISHDSMGSDVLFSKLDKVLVGFYQGKTPADIETNFLDIEITATALYEVAVPQGAKYVDLKDAKLRGGTTPFPGFGQTDGVWMAAVTCSKCQVPAPVALVILDPK